MVAPPTYWADPKTGRLFYSTAKEVDFAATLRTGSLRQSNIAAAVARCAVSANKATVCFEDYQPYAPSRGAPTAFMAAPVIEGPTLTRPTPSPASSPTPGAP